MNVLDWIIIIVIAAVVFLAAMVIIRNRKKGGGCSCGCEGCSKDCSKKETQS